MWFLNHEETFISNYFSKEKFIPFLLLNFIKILIIYFRVRVSNSPLFFKSFQIRDDILIIGETSTHLNSYPIVLFERRTFINWLKFYPSLLRYENSCPVAYSFLLASIHLFFKPEISVTRLFCERNGKWSMKVEWMRAASLILRLISWKV